MMVARKFKNFEFLKLKAFSFVVQIRYPQIYKYLYNFHKQYIYKYTPLPLATIIQ